MQKNPMTGNVFPRSQKVANPSYLNSITCDEIWCRSQSSQAKAEMKVHLDMNM